MIFFDLFDLFLIECPMIELTFAIWSIGTPFPAVQALQNRCSMHDVSGIAVVLDLRVDIVVVADDEGSGWDRWRLTGDQFADRGLARPLAIPGAIELRLPIQPVILIALVLHHRIHGGGAV